MTFEFVIERWICCDKSMTSFRMSVLTSDVWWPWHLLLLSVRSTVLGLSRVKISKPFQYLLKLYMCAPEVSDNTSPFLQLSQVASFSRNDVKGNAFLPRVSRGAASDTQCHCAPGARRPKILKTVPFSKNQRVNWPITFLLIAQCSWKPLFFNLPKFQKIRRNRFGVSHLNSVKLKKMKTDTNAVVTLCVGTKKTCPEFSCWRVKSGPTHLSWREEPIDGSRYLLFRVVLILQLQKYLFDLFWPPTRAGARTSLHLILTSDFSFPVFATSRFTCHLFWSARLYLNAFESYRVHGQTDRQTYSVIYLCRSTGFAKRSSNTF